MNAAIHFAEKATAVENANVQKYARRRKWSRTDSGRWLNERSPAVLAWLRRMPGAWPHDLSQAGYWLKEFRTPLFNAAHNRLAREQTDTARDALHVGDVLP